MFIKQWMYWRIVLFIWIVIVTMEFGLVTLSLIQHGFIPTGTWFLLEWGIEYFLKAFLGIMLLSVPIYLFYRHRKEPISVIYLILTFLILFLFGHCRSTLPRLLALLVNA